MILSVQKNMGSSLEHVGDSLEINLNDLGLEIGQPWTRSLPINAIAGNLSQMAG